MCTSSFYKLKTSKFMVWLCGSSFRSLTMTPIYIIVFHVACIAVRGSMGTYNPTIIIIIIVIAIEISLQDTTLSFG